MQGKDELICFAYPHLFADPPKGDYITLDEEEGSLWNNVVRVIPYQDPHTFVKNFLALGITPKVVVPMTEEVVLAAAMVNDMFGGLGLTTTAAVSSTHRYGLRERLHGHLFEYNPYWVPSDRLRHYWPGLSQDPDKEWVIKSAASTMNSGVRIAKFTDYYTARREVEIVKRSSYFELARLDRIVTYSRGVIEEKIEGEQYEISGIVDFKGNICHWFNPLHQWWQGTRIVNYEIVKNYARVNLLRKIAEDVVKCLGYRGCCFNAEIRGKKLIEIQPRLGEEAGDYEEKLSPGISSAQVVYNKLSQL